MEIDAADADLNWDKLCRNQQAKTYSPADCTDQELIGRITGGEKELFAELVNRHQKRVAALIYSLIQTPDEVEDVAQEVFVTVYKHLGRFEYRSSFRTWLYRITVNKCHDWQRRNYRRQGRLKPWDDDAANLTAVTMDHTEENLMVRQQVAELEAKYRMVVILYYFHSLTCYEIAGILEIPTKTVETRLRRARKLLAPKLGGIPID